MTESLYQLSRCPSIRGLFLQRTSPLPSPGSMVQSLTFRVQLTGFQSRLDIHRDCLEPLFLPLLICRGDGDSCVTASGNSVSRKVGMDLNG